MNAIFVWALADRVVLRIEDHDRQRSRAHFDAAILEDLEWLEFTWDGPITRQSARGDAYEAALDRLGGHGLLYRCACPRGHPYPGTCRDLGIPNAPGVGVRVRLDPSVERFVDLRHGPQEQRPFEQCGDLLVRDREGNWTYQFAAVVDDFEQGITHVIRGDDLLESTGRQIQLARLLGRNEPPVFLHHPLVMKSPTRKLSKSDRDTGVRALRAQGWTAEGVIGHAAFLAGLTPAAVDVHAEDVSSIITR